MPTLSQFSGTREAGRSRSDLVVTVCPYFQPLDAAILWGTALSITRRLLATIGALPRGLRRQER